MKHIPEKIIPPQELKKCVFCDRLFAPDRIHAHEAICQVSSVITRKCFDISEQILRGSDAEELIKESGIEDCGVQKSKTSGLNTNWRGKHEEFLKMVREAKQSVGKTDDDELPTSEFHQDMECIQCQYCLRYYSKFSAPRHIPICAWRNSKGSH